MVYLNARVNYDMTGRKNVTGDRTTFLVQTMFECIL